MGAHGQFQLLVPVGSRVSGSVGIGLFEFRTRFGSLAPKAVK